MEQEKLFYNLCRDLWAFAKRLKPKAEMTDRDWEEAVESMEKLAVKYGKVGAREKDLVSTLTIELLNYVENGEDLE